MFKVWPLLLIAVALPQTLPQSIKATSEGSCTKVIFLLIIVIIIIIDIDITFVVIIII